MWQPLICFHATIDLMVIRTHNLEETYQLAESFISRLRPDRARATVVALEGDLGSGKTSFTQGVAKALGIDDVITSPTFVIEKIYQPQGSMLWHHLVHIDAYRLDSGRELLTLGFAELLRDPGNLIIIEWPKRVADALPDSSMTLSFTFIDENTREITYEENR